MTTSQPSTPLQEFYALTISRSIYRVSAEKGGPVVRKIYQQNAGTSVVMAGGCLGKGKLVGIMATGLRLYTPDLRRNPNVRMLPEEALRSETGSKTSPIVALFLQESGARLAVTRTHEFKPCDKEFAQWTLETLARIGQNHPTFIPCDDNESIARKLAPGERKNST